MDSWATPQGHYDPEAVAFYNIAHEGAYLRIIAESVGRTSPRTDERGQTLPALANLAGITPRSLVILTEEQPCARAARLGVALAPHVLGSPLPVRFPTTITTALPDYVGALDCVVVLSDSGYGHGPAQALRAADARGATTVLVAPPESPLAAEIPMDTVRLEVPPTAEGPSPLRVVGTVLAVWGLLAGAERFLLSEQLGQLAELVDAELVQCSPTRELPANEARQLAEVAASASTVLHVAAHTLPEELTDLIALLWTTRGVPATSLSADEWFMASSLLQDTRHAGRDIFADPVPEEPLRQVVIWGADPEQVSVYRNEHAQATTHPTPLEASLALCVRALASTAFFLGSN